MTPAAVCCEQCGAVMPGATARKRFCVECTKQRNRQRANHHRARTNPKPGPRPCEDCQELFDGHRNKRVCESCKRQRSIVRLQALHKPVGPHVVTCTECGQTWESRSPLGKFCAACRKVRQAAQIKAWAEANREKRREYHRAGNYARKATLAQYGLTEESYQQLLDSQDGVCAICQRTHARMCVDHDHETGAVRGILCSPCNRAIGQLGDTAEHLQRAVNYLLRVAEPARG